jgi:Cu-Zn family superoxide dismutase
MCIPTERPCAIARVAGGEQAPCLCGTVKFYRTGKNVLVVADICGLPDSETGIFGMHIHEGDSCMGADFENTGSHYDPDGRPHPNHAGDLPPLFSCRGNAFLAVMTDRFCLRDILGRTVVIHSQADDFRSQPAGNAGEKIGCGVIRQF